MKLLYTTILLLITTLTSFSSECFVHSKTVPYVWVKEPPKPPPPDYLNLPLYKGLGYGAITDSSVTFTISDVSFTNTNANFASGCGLRISNSSNITIENCYFNNFNNLAVYLTGGCFNITIRNCLVANASWGFLAEDCTNNIKWLNNEFINMFGQKIGQGCCRGQFMYFIRTTGTGNQISWNRGMNFFGESWNEDLVSSYSSGGTSGSHMRISGNVFVFSGPSKSGGGILTGDASSSYVDVDSNRMIQGGIYGMGVAGGSNITVTNNMVWAARNRWSGTGYYAYANPAACSNITFSSNNKAYYLIYTNSGQDNYYQPGSCSPCTCSSPTSLGASEAAAYTAITTGIPDPLITFITPDQVYQLRSVKTWSPDLVSQGNAGYDLRNNPGTLTYFDMSRPTSNAGADQPSVTTTTATLTGTSSTATQPASNMTGTNTITYLWEQVSGPNTATMSASTSATNNLSSLITGTYIFRLRIKQDSPWNTNGSLYSNTWYPNPGDPPIPDDSYDYDTYHWDWMTMTVSTSGSIRYKGRMF